MYSVQAAALPALSADTCDVTSHDKSRATQPTAEEPPAAVAAEEKVDNDNIVDKDNMSGVSELSEYLELPDTNSYDKFHDNINNNIVHNLSLSRIYIFWQLVVCFSICLDNHSL